LGLQGGGADVWRPGRAERGRRDLSCWEEAAHRSRGRGRIAFFGAESVAFETDSSR